MSRDKAQGASIMAHIKKDCLVQVAVTRRERERWIAAASRADMTVSELVREAVRARLAGVIHVLDVGEVRTAMQSQTDD